MGESRGRRGGGGGEVLALNFVQAYETHVRCLTVLRLV